MAIEGAATPDITADVQPSATRAFSLGDAYLKISWILSASSSFSGALSFYFFREVQPPIVILDGFNYKCVAIKFDS